jgi:hypothetical protein
MGHLSWDWNLSFDDILESLFRQQTRWEDWLTDVFRVVVHFLERILEVSDVVVIRQRWGSCLKEVIVQAVFWDHCANLASTSKGVEVVIFGIVTLQKLDVGRRIFVVAFGNGCDFDRVRRVTDLALIHHRVWVWHVQGSSTTDIAVEVLSASVVKIDATERCKHNTRINAPSESVPQIPGFVLLSVAAEPKVVSKPRKIGFNIRHPVRSSFSWQTALWASKANIQLGFLQLYRFALRISLVTRYCQPEWSTVCVNA